MAVAIKAENLSKAYQLGEIGTGTLSRDLERWVAKLRGKEDPFLKIGEANDRTTKGTSDIVWSLKDINFEIEQGDAVGIIGRNGAGKSTLLKLLSRVTSPTTGGFKARGRIASLLEVGTGFHPELTGRENIYLNGAILGMRKKEITRKFDEIVEFSGVERYVDTPVKRYSSGMYVRLAFAVAAHLESEILIVDEVLAVGDAEFQEKCLGKMNDVSKGEGRTVLFVSHNMAAVGTLCRTGLVLEYGNCKFEGSAKEAIQYYLKPENVKVSRLKDKINFCHTDFIIDTITINGSEEDMVYVSNEKTYLDVSIKGKISTDKNVAFGLTLLDNMSMKLGIYSPGHITGKIKKFKEGRFEINEHVNIPNNITKGTFQVQIALHEPNVEMYLAVNNIELTTQGVSGATGLEFSYIDNGLLIL